MGILYDEVRAATIMVESESLVYYQLAGDLFKAALNGKNGTIASLEKMQEIDEVINTVSGTNTLYDGKVIRAYQPERLWLWQQYTGTVLKISRDTVFLAMAGSALFVIFAKLTTNEPIIWEVSFISPDQDQGNPLIKDLLSQVHTIWEIQKTLTTFVLTFFVNQSFRFWGDVYKSVRDVQGRLSSFNLLLATNVLRTANGSLTPEAEKFLDEVGQCTRLFHILFWASKAKRFSVLMSDEGLKRMESRGLMSSRQLYMLLGTDLPSNQLFSAPLEWAMLRCNKASDEGVLMADNATKSSILREFMSLRNAFDKIGNTIQNRFPLAYVQFVQILVDTYVLCSPLALYVDLEEYVVIAVGLVVFFYCGLNNLAKIFLDPLNNEEFCENSIYFDLGVIASGTCF
ncbi:hypothetical protein ACHAWT_002298 [Skeletonema menzelii]